MKRSAQRDKSELVKILKSFGFKKANNTDFIHENGIYADVIDMGAFCEVWMTGQGCKQSAGFPGGYNYGPDSLVTELNKVLKNESKPLR